MKQTNSKIKSVLFGIAVGDALGVPYEFISRERMKVLPGTKNAVNLGTSLQFKWEHKYSKIGNKSTVISYNFINQVLPCRPIYKKGMQWTLDKNNLSSCTTRFNGFGR